MSRLEVIREFDPWKSPLCTCPKKYSLHPYTGCSHFCLYCYATSYIGVKESKPKERFEAKLLRDLRKIGPGALVELSTSSDPYPPVEEKLCITRRSIEALVSFGMKILITTKSSLVARDIELLLKAPAAVMVTITALDEKIAKIIEPGAPSPKKRLEAIREVSKRGVPVGVRVDPIIPFINDEPLDLEELVGTAAEAGALHVVTSTYKAKWNSMKRLAEAFPDIAKKIYTLYRESCHRVHGYRYLLPVMRKQLLKPVIEAAKAYGLTYATCREGLGPDFFNAPSCDGSHLISYSKTTQSKGKT